MKDFFISYNKADRKAAEWVGWVLEEAGYSVVLQSWDFRPGENFILEMHRAATETRSTVALLSANYLDSEYAQQELAAALASDPLGQRRRLIPIRVGEFKPEGLLGSIVYADIVGLPQEEARLAVLQALSERAKPDAPPPFPDLAAPLSSPVPAAPPPFPAPALEPKTGEFRQWHQPAAGFRPTRRLSCTVTFAAVVFAIGIQWFASRKGEIPTGPLLARAEAQYKLVIPVVEDTRLRGVSLSQSVDAGQVGATEETVGQTISKIDGVLRESQSAYDNLARASEQDADPELKEYISYKLQAARVTHESLLNYRNALVGISLDLSQADRGDAAALARARDELRDANLTYAARLVLAREFDRLAADVAARFPEKIQTPRSD